MRAGLGVVTDRPPGASHHTCLSSLLGGRTEPRGRDPYFHRAGGAGLGKPQGLWVPRRGPQLQTELCEDRARVRGRHLAGVCCLLVITICQALF